MLRVLGQMSQAYIVAEGPEGMYLIDQHAAHERVLYERLQAERAPLTVASQGLLEPQVIELLPRQHEVIEVNRETLARLGFSIEPFGENAFLVRAVPAALAGANLVQTIGEIIDEATADQSATSWEEGLIVSLACHSAVRAGQMLSLEEMRQLVQQLEETSMPRTCAHGRPTMVLLSTAQLEKEFGRK
jgi:DNA mismatch repair protein MutL